MRKTEKSMKTTFRILGWAEGASFLLLLFVAMPIKYMVGNPEFVKLMGPIHGGLFLLYVLLANYIAKEMNWNIRIRLYSFIASVLPFGTFVFERKFLK